MIKFVSKNELIDYYKQCPQNNDFEKRRADLYLNMYDNPLVDALYLYYMDKDEYIGECILIFKDNRKTFEFEYENDLVNKPYTCLLKNLYIRDDKCGMGYFTKFLNEIKIIAKNKKCKYLTFSVSKDNTHALKVYKHLNAYQVGKEHFYNDIGQTIFMQIDIE